MFVLPHFLSRIRSMSCCFSLQQIGEINLDSARGQSYGTKRESPLTTEQFLLSLLSWSTVLRVARNCRVQFSL